MHGYAPLSADQVTDDKIRRAYEYWQKARHGRPMPLKKDIDPLDLRFCLGWICLIDVVRTPNLRFRFRLDGSNLVSLTGYDLTGQFVDEFADRTLAKFVTMIYEHAVATKAGVFLSNSEDWDNRGFLMQSATLPLANEEDQVVGLLDVISPTLMAARPEPYAAPHQSHPGSVSLR